MMHRTCRIVIEMSDAEIERVAFFKRDELTTDLICCEVIGGRGSIVANEEMSGWAELINRLSCLTGFDDAWFAKVSQPAFRACFYVAFPPAE